MNNRRFLYVFIMHPSAGINGFGRFGQHLLKYWLEQPEHFSIRYINDPILTLQEVVRILSNDRYLSSFYRSRLRIEGSMLMVEDTRNQTHAIEYTTHTGDKIAWLGKPEFFFECSGKYTQGNEARNFLKGNTKTVIISATVQQPDKVLVYGFNEREYLPENKVISYGSCTINAYVPLANFINKKYGVIESDFHIIHNIAEYQIPQLPTLKRTGSTVEYVAPKLLPFLNASNFVVACTYIPYSGVSMLDYRFRLRDVRTGSQYINDIAEATAEGDLKGLYSLDEVDHGPGYYKFTPFSAVIIKNNLRVSGDGLYIHAYFDNENSVTRFYDLACFISGRMS